MDEAAKLASSRTSMVDNQLVRRGIIDVRVLAAMRKVPREQFVPEALQQRAHEDCALPIAHNQTISQPFIVALMSELLSLEGCERVLEVGTGSGYQTAVLAELIGSQGVLWSIERHAALSQAAGEILKTLGYAKVQLHVGDGSLGLPDQAPFDAILVAAATPRCPPALWQQVRTGGRIVIPLGDTEGQQLVLLEKGEAGEPISTSQVSCRFVPLVSNRT